jgi:hypothetical protein
MFNLSDEENQITFGDEVAVLLCNYRYHSECINTWLGLNRTRPLCKAKVR